jgi:hypothetical protein|tara:strand:- start:10899 stop:11087 length:189 start_codon:yes stop_codon:yes gene_type:complete
MNNLDTNLKKLQDLAVEVHYTKNFTAVLDLLQKVLDNQDTIFCKINDLQSNVEDIRERMITK